MLIYTLSLGANPEFSHTHNPRKSIVPKMLSITDVCQLIKGQRGEEIARRVISRAGLDPWASSVLSTPQEQLPPRAASSSTTNVLCSHSWRHFRDETTKPQINEMVTALGRGLAGGPWMGTHQRHLHQPTLPGRETARSPLLKGRAQGVLVGFRITPQSPGHWVVPPGISPSTSYLPAPSSKSQEYTTQMPLLPSMPRLDRGEKIHSIVLWNTHQEAYQERGPCGAWQRAP